MSNDFYNHGSFPTTGSAATSASMRAELDSIAAGFDKMPTLTGNANEIVVVNSSATGLSSIATLPAGSGGTGIASYTIGDLVYASSTTVLSKLADVATGNALISGGVGVAPSYGKIGLATHVSGTLPTANGGTGLTGFTANGVVYASSTSALATGSAFTFDGNGVVISVNSTVDALRITQLGTGNALLIEDSTSPDSTPIVVDQAGLMVLGATTNQAANLATGNAKLQILGGTAPLAFFRDADSSTAINLEFAKRRATGGVLQSGDVIGRLYFSGNDGTAAIPAAFIDAAVDGTPGTNDMPGRLVFSTTADGAATPTERMRIDSAGQVTIGGSPTAGVSVYLRKNLTGATTSFGVAQNVQIQSDVTTTANLFSSTYSTAASAFTLTSVNHYNAQQGTIGATSAVTNQYGFAAQSSLTGATNNYGFYSDIPAAANRYNFYANGTADNFFGGDVIVDVSTTDPALRVTQRGAGNALLIEDSANPDSTPFVIDASGNVGIGATTASQKLDLSSDGTLTIQSTRYSTDASEPAITIRKARGTRASPSIVSSGDTVTSLNFQGYDGAAFLNAARIFAQIDGTPGTNDMPGRLVFATTADGASSPTERMRIDSSGNAGIGTASPAVPLDIYNSTSAVTRLQGDSNVNTQLARYSTDNQPPVSIIRKGRGTVASPSAVASGDTMGQLVFQAYGGANNRSLAAISGAVSAYTSDTDISSFLNFSTTSSGSVTAAERMRIDSSGNVGIGTASPESGFKLHVVGNAFVQNIAGQTVGKVVVDNADNRLVLGSYFESGVGQYSFISSTDNAETGNIPLLFRTGTTERVRIDSAGVVSIVNQLTLSGTGAAVMNVGTTAQRPTPATGMFRFNSTLSKFEGYTGSAWGSVGGGATGGGSDEVFVENSLTVTTSYSISAGKSASSTGPITINAGATVTVPTGSRWVVL